MPFIPGDRFDESGDNGDTVTTIESGVSRHEGWLYVFSYTGLTDTFMAWDPEHKHSLVAIAKRCRSYSNCLTKTKMGTLGDAT